MTDVLHRPGKPVGAIIGAMRVIRALHKSPRPMNASQVARATDLYRGTAYNILRTLEVEGIVSHDPQDKTYTVSLRTLEIAYGALRKSGLMDLARPLMHAISEAHPVTIYVVQVIDHRTLLTCRLGRSSVSHRFLRWRRATLPDGIRRSWSDRCRLHAE